MSQRFRGAAAIQVSAASGSLCLLAAGALWVAGGHQQGVAAVPFGAATSSPAAVIAPSVAEGGEPFPFTASPTIEPASSVGGVPVILRLPGRPDVPIDPVGVAPDGSVGIPDDPSRAGWWAAGPAPGDPVGGAVLVGHLDSAAHGLGAFVALIDVSPGTGLTVEDSAGTQHHYVVTEREQVDKAALPQSLFSRMGPARLVLITCGGRFDPATHHYDDNVIVTAEPSPR